VLRDGGAAPVPYEIMGVVWSFWLIAMRERAGSPVWLASAWGLGVYICAEVLLIHSEGAVCLRYTRRERVYMFFAFLLCSAIPVVLLLFARTVIP